ncbi:DoxX family protein [Thalassobaculum sp.]|uniref:DoxX family protein n=1 Tax=Thalassobaculum sp. TaxID=2022740 RepID=UPI0032F0667E
MTDDKAAAYAALLLRLTIGVAMLAHGALKVFVFTVPGTVQFFESVGYPALFAYLVILAEFGGGAALLLGIAVRPVALALIPVMIGATLQHAGNGWLFSAPGGGWEFPAFWTVTLVVQALLGAGALAVRLPVPAAIPAWTR